MRSVPRSDKKQTSGDLIDTVFQIDEQVVVEFKNFLKSQTGTFLVMKVQKSSAAQICL